MRPPRKYTHIEKETPQIYSVKRVLEVLDQQKEELMQEKRKKLEEALRA
jgi:restriction endonuclease S subunit